MLISSNCSPCYVSAMEPAETIVPGTPPSTAPTIKDRTLLRRWPPIERHIVTEFRRNKASTCVRVVAKSGAMMLLWVPSRA